MGWLEAEKREGTIESGSGGVTVSQLFGAAPDTAAGVPVNDRTARKYSAFFRAVTYSSGHIGTIPVHLFEKRSDGRGRDEVTRHPASDMIRRQANEEMSASSFKEALHGHVLTRGNGLAHIIRNGKRQAMELWPLSPTKTDLKRDDEGRPFYATKIRGDRVRLPFGSVLHVRGPGGDGLHGWSVLRLARESIGLGLAAEEYSSRFFSNNATPSGILTTPTGLEPEQKERLKKAWNRAHGGLSKQHKVALLEGDLDWQSLGISAEDAQLLESRRFSIQDMARWFGLPPHKLMENSNATFSNIESQNIEVRIDHLRPWARRWEEALDNRVLTQKERDRGLFFKFNLDALLRADSQARAEKQRTEVTHGLATINEIRALEERNPVDSEFADTPLVRRDVMTLDMAGQTTPSERALMAAVDNGDTEAISRLAEVRIKELERDTGTREETRSPQGRRELVETWRPIFRRDFERLVRIESQDIRSEASLLVEQGVDAFLEFLDEFYSDDIIGLVDRSLTDVFRQYARAVTREAASEVEDGNPLTDDALRGFMGDPQDAQDEGDAETYLGGFTRRYAATSRVKLSKAVERAQDREDDDPREALDRELERWNEGDEETRSRPEQKAQNEANQVSNAIAKTTFAAAGVTALRWVTVGGNCPMCNALEGTVVSIQSNFVGEGDTLVGEDDETEITPRTNVGHPPLHPGCDCLVVPGG